MSLHQQPRLFLGQQPAIPHDADHVGVLGLLYVVVVMMTLTPVCARDWRWDQILALTTGSTPTVGSSRIKILVEYSIRKSLSVDAVHM